jgi:hypothetical protein
LAKSGHVAGNIPKNYNPQSDEENLPERRRDLPPSFVLYMFYSPVME